MCTYFTPQNFHDRLFTDDGFDKNFLLKWMNQKCLWQIVQYTPATWAAENGHLEVLKYLVEHGAHIEKYAICIAAGRGYLNVVQYLYRKIPKDDRVEYAAEAIPYAAMNGHLDIIKYLYKENENLDIHLRQCLFTADNNGAIRYAARNGHLEVVKYLIKHKADVKADNNYAICMASERGHLEVVKYFAEHGADVTARCNKPIHVASENGHWEIVKYLVEHGANPTCVDGKALVVAVRMQRTEVVEYLLSLDVYSTEMVRQLDSTNSTISTMLKGYEHYPMIKGIR